MVYNNTSYQSFLVCAGHLYYTFVKHITLISFINYCPCKSMDVYSVFYIYMPIISPSAEGRIFTSINNYRFHWNITYIVSTAPAYMLSLFGSYHNHDHS